MSASHIAYGSIRMEPVFMILGQSAATAAAMAIDAGIAVQDVSYQKLRDRLLKDGQILHYTGPSTVRGLDARKLPGIVVDDEQAKLTGEWKESTVGKTFVGDSFRHDGNAKDGKASARFEAKLPKSGSYEVRFGYVANNNRSSKTMVEIVYSGGTKKIVVDQKKTPPIDGLFLSLGKFEFTADQPAAVVISNFGSDGYVVIDSVQWLPQ